MSKKRGISGAKVAKTAKTLRL